MNVTDIALMANIGEIIAAVMVVVSLIYVALQVRQNTHTLQVTAAQAYVVMYNTLTSELAKSDCAVIWHKGLANFECLEGGELVQFSAISGQLMRIYESAFLQWRKGALDDQIWQASRNGLRDALTAPGFRQWWQYRKSWYSEDFRQFLDSWDAEQDSQPVYPDMPMEIGH